MKIEKIKIWNSPLAAGLLIGLLLLAFAATGCDEGVNMTNGVVTGPTDPDDGPAEPEPTNPTTNGEVKQPEEPTDPTDPEEPTEPTPEPTVAIAAAVQEDDGSVTVSGTSTDVPKGTTVTVTLGDAVTGTAATDSAGVWSVTLTPEQVNTLGVGTVPVTAVVGEATDTDSLVITEPEVPIDTTQPDFVGQVLMPTGEFLLRSTARAVVGATVTIVSGPRAGEEVTTDSDGNYRFKHIAEEALHLQVKKEEIEPKEVVVHRSEPTALTDGTVLDLYGDLQKNPGIILVGHKWPDKVRFILEETTLPPDLLLVRVEHASETISGLYADGVVVVEEGNCLLKTIAHELGHAYQHAMATIDAGQDAPTVHWVETPSGKAYAEARQRDWEEIGKASYDAGHHLVLYENMAETAKRFWNIRGKFDTPLCFSTKQNIPSRLKWAEEWLGKK